MKRQRPEIKLYKGEPYCVCTDDCRVHCARYEWCCPARKAREERIPDVGISEIGRQRQ